MKHLEYPKLDEIAIFLEPVIGGSGKDSGQSHTAAVEAVYFDSEHRFYQGRFTKAEYRKVGSPLCTTHNPHASSFSTRNVGGGGVKPVRVCVNAVPPPEL